MGTKRPCETPTWTETILEPFQTLSESNTLVSLGSVRDVIVDKLIDDSESQLSHVVMLVLTDADKEINLLHESNDLPMIEFKTKLSEGDSIPKCESTLLYVPLSKVADEATKRSKKKEIKKLNKKLKKNHKSMGLDLYILSDSDREKQFAALQTTLAEGYIQTNPLGKGEKLTHAMLAIDCEMCKTTKGIELTRISIVDEQHVVLLDEYVLPSNPIIDYCTKYSGITRETLEGCTNTLESIQAQILEIIPAETILVGHSIENDLRALRLIHNRIMDTCAMYPHPKGPPFRCALRYLSSMYLKVEIQTGIDGHCSVEDATCAMKLAQLKIKKGPLFPSITSKSRVRKVVEELFNQKKSVLIVDTAASCRNLASSSAAVIPCTSPDMVFHHVRHQLTTGCPPTFTWSQALCTENISKIIHDIYNDLPTQALLVVVTCPSVTELKSLHKIRTTRGDPRCTLLWDKTQQEELNAVAARTQEGNVMVFAKGST